jgi:hypothetical protein
MPTIRHQVVKINCYFQGASSRGDPFLLPLLFHLFWIPSHKNMYVSDEAMSF